MSPHPLLDLPPSLFRSFLAVANSLSFTAAAARLDLRQSTISQHIKKLEDATGQRLLLRDTHSVALTEEGDAMMEIARNILDANDRLVSYFIDKGTRERLRLGISEDFAMSRLANVLIAFKRHDPHVDIELTVGLSGYLYQRFDAGDLDVIFVKRKPGDRRGKIAWRERLVWIARPALLLPPNLPVPLVAFAPPSITRSLATETLQKAGRSWRITCSSGSISGLRAALVAGLGLAAHSGRLVPSGLVQLSNEANLPQLPEIEFVAIGPGRTQPLAMRMVDMLVENSESLRQARH
ncbi:LysR family transcriptional regulator [Hoeflea sp. G2-23]|uniref:LysR family transcriptional regulator n=1 Tax=Hoeflea algicola TaxID=2983763 RepID=A0ABT3Z8W9_9HYPH|nr:LysR family transcriptional regulator [Hoeflea algicola]MCY0148169.1 LysR family transcriptional regulator [Hoeflea algicola]